MNGSSAFELRPRTIGELLDLVFRIYRKTFPTLAVVGVVTSLLGAVAGGTFEALLAHEVSASQDPASILLLTVFAGPVILLISWVSHSLLALSAAVAVGDVFSGAPSRLGSNLSRALRRWPAAIWTSLLTGIPCMLGFFCCCLPGLALTVLFSFAIPTVHYEHLSGFRAIGRSVELVLGRGPSGFTVEANWVRVAVVGLGVLVVMYLLSTLSATPIIALALLQRAREDQLYQTLLGPQPVPLWALLPMRVVSAVLQGLVVPISMLPWPVLYHDVRMRNEGLDLEIAAKRALAGGAAAAIPASPS